MKKSILTGFIVVLLSGIGLEDAIAQPPDWAMDGAGCVPTDPAIQNDSYIITAGRIKFKDPKVGSITVICPVSVKVGSINSIGVSYRDSTGVGTSARVRAALRRINKFNGSVSTVTGLVFDSNNEGETNYTFQTAFTSHTLDDSNFYYFIQVTLTRSSTSEIIEFGGVELLDVIT
jgi:hypothetical protein